MRRMRKRARFLTAKSTSGWRNVAPKGPSEREQLYRRCGAGAFLEYDPRDPGYSKFPIVGRFGPCAPDCRALRAAYSRAKQYGHRKLAEKALNKAEALNCGWTR